MRQALVFIGSGLVTFAIYDWVSKTIFGEFELGHQLLTGLPFGLACSFCLVRPRKWIIVSAFLDCLAWVGAYRLAAATVDFNPYVGMSAAGLVGAIAVTLSTGLGQRTLYTTRTLAGAALVGAIVGAAFVPPLVWSDQRFPALVILFPLWQVAVGLWISKSIARHAHV